MIVVVVENSNFGEIKKTVEHRRISTSLSTPGYEGVNFGSGNKKFLVLSS